VAAYKPLKTGGEMLWMNRRVDNHCRLPFVTCARFRFRGPRSLHFRQTTWLLEPELTEDHDASCCEEPLASPLCT